MSARRKSSSSGGGGRGLNDDRRGRGGGGGLRGGYVVVNSETSSGASVVHQLESTNRKWKRNCYQWWRRRSKTARLAMQALGASVLLALILNLYAQIGTGLAQQRAPRPAQQQNNGANWISQKVNHLRESPPVEDDNLKYFANVLSSKTDLEKHISNILIPRVSGTPGNAKVRKYIIDTMRGNDWDVRTVKHSQRTPVGNVEFQNVVATLDPNAPRRLVLACHYDSLIKPVGFLGATDSAVPCAQMLNLAHAMDRDIKDTRARRNELTLQLIFFDGEEAFVRWSRSDSTYGARNLAKVWKNETYGYQGVEGNTLQRMDLMVLLDLIGASNPKFTSTQEKTQLHFNRMARIENGLRNTEPRSSLSGNNRIFQRRSNYNAMVEDDHIPFLERGVPILHMIVLPFPSVWHKASDAAAAIDMTDTENVNKIIRVFVAEYMQLTKPTSLQRAY